MPQTRWQIEQLLQSIGRSANRKLGQHFMIDARCVERLVAEAGLTEPGWSGLVLEVGPGTGTLTESLLEAGAEVLAVEIDRYLVDLLDRQFSRTFAGRFHLLSGDVLAGKHRLNEQMVEALARLSQRPARPVRMAANLPYNIACPLLAELIGLAWRTHQGQADQPVRIDRLVFTVQREVADRLIGLPGTKDYGPMSVLAQGLGRVTVLAGKISPNAFYPMPNVYSSMLRIDLPAERLAAVADLDALHAWLDAGFGHRRKTLAASIRLAGGDWPTRLTTAALTVGLDTARRGETLTVAEYLTLASETRPNTGS